MEASIGGCVLRGRKWFLGRDEETAAVPQIQADNVY